MPKPTSTDDVADLTISRAAQIVDGIITAAKFVAGIIIAAASKLTTTTYTVQEVDLAAYNGISILVKRTAGNGNGQIAVQPKGTGIAAGLTIYTNEDQANSSLMDINAIDAIQAQIAIDKTGTGLELPQFGIYFVVSNKQWIFKPASLTIPDAANVILGTGTGTKIGTATSQKVGFYNSAPVIQQIDGAALVNNVTVGGTTNQIDNFTDLSVYANSAAAIRNDIYQLARKLKIIDDALRLYGLLS